MILKAPQIQEVLKRHNPYGWADCDYAIEAKELEEKLNNRRYGIWRELIDMCVGSTLYCWGWQELV